MHGKTLLLLAFLFPLAIQRGAIPQDPHLFLSLPEIAHRNAIADREPWARAGRDEMMQVADSFPGDNAAGA